MTLYTHAHLLPALIQVLYSCIYVLSVIAPIIIVPTSQPLYAPG